MTPAGLVLLAAAGDPSPWNQPGTLAIIAGFATVLVAVLGVAGNAVVKRLNKPVDDATAIKTIVDAEKTRVDIQGREVEIARSLLDEIRKELDRVRADQDRDRRAMEQRLTEQAETSERRHQEMIRDADKRHDQLTAELSEVRQQQELMHRQMEDHAPWDRAARDLIRQAQPDFPDWPPIDGHAP